MSASTEQLIMCSISDLFLPNWLERLCYFGLRSSFPLIYSHWHFPSCKVHVTYLLYRPTYISIHFLFVYSLIVNLLAIALSIGKTPNVSVFAVKSPRGGARMTQ